MSIKITEYIKEKIAEYCKVYDKGPAAINNGLCGQFAEDIDEAGFGDVYWGDETDKVMWAVEIQNIWLDWLARIAPYHAFILYEGRYYDSESPEGVGSPDQLGYFQRSIDYEPWVIECLKDNSKCILI